MRNRIANKLIINIERNITLSKQILECEELLKEIKNKEGIYNYIFKKIRLKFRTRYNDGVHTDLDMDEIFMEDLKKAILKRKERIENHAKKFIKE